MTVTASWQPDETSREVIAHLAAGACVVLPTESTYELVASAFSEPAIQRIAETQQGSIALTHAAETADWLPLLTGAGARLVRKVGAGPYVLQADAGYRAGLFQHLPEFAKEVVSSEQGLRVRLPDHPIWNELRPLGRPLISVPIAGALEAAEAARIVGDQAALIVDAGPTLFNVLPSVVNVEGRKATIMRAGGLTQEQFGEITLCRVLFVCTGNTCRSPMAEALCVKLLADRLGCDAAGLKQQGFSVQSAGLAAMMGCEASSEAVDVVAEMGGDLSRHRSCTATLDMLQWADHVFAMTAGHWHALARVDLPNLPTPEMLSPHLEDIADPIGQPLVEYHRCAHQILECLKQRLPRILES